MRFLADEHIPLGVMIALRANGHEVLAASQIGRGKADEVHVTFAAREGLVILTEDADFTARVREAADAGEDLPFALVHYRLDGLGRASKMARMIGAIAEIGEAVSGTMYSVEPTRIRQRSIRS